MYIHMTVCVCTYVESSSNSDIILFFISDFITVLLHIQINDQCIWESCQFCIQFIFQVFDVLNHGYLKNHISFHYADCAL